MSKDKNKYIYILEDFTVCVGPAPSAEDLQMCDDGYLSVINTDSMLEYEDGNWVELEDFIQ